MTTKTKARGQGSPKSQGQRVVKGAKPISRRKEARVGMAVRQVSTNTSRGAEASRTGAYGKIVKLNKTRAEVKFVGWEGRYRVDYEALGKVAGIPKGISKALRSANRS